MALTFWGRFGTNRLQQVGMAGNEKLLGFALTGVHKETPTYQAEQIGVVRRPPVSDCQVPTYPRRLRDSSLPNIPDPAELLFHYRISSVPLIKVMYSLKTMGSVRPFHLIYVVRLLDTGGNKIVIHSPYSHLAFVTEHGTLVDPWSIRSLSPTTLQILRRKQTLPTGVEETILFQENNEVGTTKTKKRSKLTMRKMKI